MKRRVVIIGAGIGGLAAAIHLARKKYKVIVLEKNSSAGGRCDQIIKNGHKFDIGPTFLLFPEIYRKMFEAFGEDIKDHLELVRVDPAQQICFEDNITLLCTANKSRMRTQLESFEQGSYEGFIKFMSKAKIQYELSLMKIIQKDFQHFFDYFNISNLHYLLKTNVFEIHSNFMGRFFTDTRLKAAFTFQDSYLGLSPFTSPAIYSLIAYSEFIHGVWFPKGGMHKVVKALVNIAEKNNVEIKYNSPVVEIITSNKQATGVRTKKKRFPANVVVANSDLPHAYQYLLPKSNYGEKLKQKKYSCSTITFFWGLKRPYPKLLTHNLFLADSYKESYDDVINKHTLPSKPHFYVHTPSRIDPSMAPKGADTIIIHVPVGHITPSSLNKWKSLSEKARKFVIARLEKFGLDDIAKQIKFEITTTPLDWQQRYNLTHGSTLGLHHNITQMGYLRPHRQHQIFKNLYFVGSNTHPGSGVPTVLLSAFFTSRQIFEQEKLKKI